MARHPTMSPRWFKQLLCPLLPPARLPTHQPNPQHRHWPPSLARPPPLGPFGQRTLPVSLLGLQRPRALSARITGSRRFPAAVFLRGAGGGVGFTSLVLVLT